MLDPKLPPTPHRPVDELLPQAGVSLSQHTTLGLGGQAQWYCEVQTETELEQAVRWAEQQGHQLRFLAGGSNLVVADAGVDGLVVKLSLSGLDWQEQGEQVVGTIGAGEAWDQVVQQSVSRNYLGIECLSGIPGFAGATPIQNVGAYGQEVSQVIRRVRVYDLENRVFVWLSSEECNFSYRHSRFKAEPGKFVVTLVEIVLRTSGKPELRYGELSRALEGQEANASKVREAVLALRRRKSMVVDESDPHSQSAGSFFTNPIVDETLRDQVVQKALDLGLVEEPTQVPVYTYLDRYKLSAAWLIERSGFQKGYRKGGAGLSANHCLALVNYEGSSAELWALAKEVQKGVNDRFSVELHPEPVCWD